PPELQFQRLLDNRDMDEHEAHQRITAQTSREDRRSRANYVIENSGTLSDLERQVDQMWTALQNADPDRPLLAGPGK
ncbi:MAG TPA: dephospho-CoA kinase, partial [Actinomycetota bacterium]|nr:dephospho-CoA kinase [Actinomycetota bacterium]